jgi:hypothetical protein
MTTKRDQSKGKYAKRWKRCEWGWNLEFKDGWTAQVYDDEPLVWRVFFKHDMLAEGPADNDLRARGQSRAVLIALAEHV